VKTAHPGYYSDPDYIIGAPKGGVGRLAPIPSGKKSTTKREHSGRRVAQPPPFVLGHETQAIQEKVVKKKTKKIAPREDEMMVSSYSNNPNVVQNVEAFKHFLLQNDS